jgi:uncharacterized protein
MLQEIAVTTQKISFPHGTHSVVGNLFLPPDFNAHTTYAAVVVTHPFGGVKEQTFGLYAQKLAELGFVTLAYDASHYGESGGEPRLYEVPADRVEDIRCAVDYLTNRPQVDENRIGALGICAGGGYTVNAAQTDVRIKAVATVSCFDVRSAPPGGRAARHVLRRVPHQPVAGDRRATGAGSAWGAPAADLIRARIGGRDHRGHAGALSGGLRLLLHTEGAAPERTGQVVFTSLGLQMAFFPFQQVETISPRPLLMIAGSKADTRYFSEEAIAKAKDPKELFIIEGATQHRPVRQARVRAAGRRQATGLFLSVSLGRSLGGVAGLHRPLR